MINFNMVDVVGVVGFVDYKGKDLFNAAAIFNRKQVGWYSLQDVVAHV